MQYKSLNFVTSILRFEYPPYNNVAISTQFLCSLFDRRTQIGSSLLLNVINGAIDYSNLLLLLKFKVPFFRMRTSILFVVLLYSTSYGFNNPIHRIMRRINISFIKFFNYNCFLLILIKY